MSNVKVKRKGQVTIPAGLRRRLDIQEGSLLEVEEHEKGVLFTPVKPLRAGDVAGEGKYREVLRDLETLRKKWR